MMNLCSHSVFTFFLPQKYPQDEVKVVRNQLSGKFWSEERSKAVNYVGGIMWVGLCWWIYVGCRLMFSVICFNVKKFTSHK